MQQPDAEALEANLISAQEKEERDIRLSCRFYEDNFPELETCVMVQVKNIAVSEVLACFLRLPLTVLAARAIRATRPRVGR